MTSIKGRDAKKNLSKAPIPEKPKSEPPMGHKKSPALSCKTEVDTAFRIIAGD